jgi:3-keto-L-gulonate-6-phosphate decarboxylase
MKPIVQVSLDLTDINEALEMAHIAMRAGVDWLEAGTPFIIAEGKHEKELDSMDGSVLKMVLMEWSRCTNLPNS